MPVNRLRHRETPYFQMQRAAAQDARLSWEATGLLAYLLSKPDGWEVNGRAIARERSAGREKVGRILKELRTFGYLRLVRLKTEDGRFAWETWVEEEPRPDPGNPEVDLTSDDEAFGQVGPWTGNQAMGNQATANPATREDREEKTEREKTDQQTTESDGDFRPPSNVRELKATARSLQAMKDGSSRAYLRYVERLGRKPEGSRSSKPWHDELLKLFQAGHPVDRIDAALDACGESPWKLPEAAAILKGQADHPRTVPDRPEYQPMVRREDQDLPWDPEAQRVIAERVFRNAAERARRLQAAGHELNDADQRALAWVEANGGEDA
jgi:hypothetical protein